MSEELQSIRQELGEIKGELRGLAKLVDTYITTQNGRHEKIEKSIRCLDAALNQAKGAKATMILLIAGASSVIGAGAAKLAKWL